VTYSTLSSDLRLIIKDFLSEGSLPTAGAQAIYALTAQLADHTNANWVAWFCAQTR
jgi:hypothetical protein